MCSKAEQHSAAEAGKPGWALDADCRRPAPVPQQLHLSCTRQVRLLHTEPWGLSAMLFAAAQPSASFLETYFLGCCQDYYCLLEFSYIQLQIISKRGPVYLAYNEYYSVSKFTKNSYLTKGQMIRAPVCCVIYKLLMALLDSFCLNLLLFNLLLYYLCAP